MTDTNETKLAPCPFCRLRLQPITMLGEIVGFQHPRNDCFLSAVTIYDRNHRRVESWNRRADPAQEQE